VPIDDQMRADVHKYMLQIAGGLSRQEIADKVFAEFKDLWPLIEADQKVKWCWQELRGLQTDDDEQLKLPLVGLFPPKGGHIAGADAIVKPMSEWERMDYAYKWRQSDHNVQAHTRRRDAYASQFAKAFPGEQLEMFIRGLGD
jgi:hypothetical protein